MNTRVIVALLFVVALIFSGCSKDESDPAPDVQLGDVPVIKSATEVTVSSFKANWSKVDGAKFYKLDVSTDVEFKTMVDGYAAKLVSDTTVSVTGMNAGDKLFFRVKAGNSLGETGYSRVAAVRGIDKALLYDILWKGDAVKSKLAGGAMFQDLRFYSSGLFAGYFGERVMTSGTWKWKGSTNIMEIKLTGSSGTSYEINFLDVGSDYYVAYFSIITSELAFFNK